MHTTHHYTLGEKQDTILFFFYRFRFLQARHIQQLFTHTTPRYAQRLLKHLLETEYLFAFYDHTTMLGRKTPTVYCLTTKAKHILKQNPACDSIFLENLYKEKTKSVQFQNRCLLLADSYFLLTKQANEQKMTISFFPKTDLLSYGDFPKPLPDAYLVTTHALKKKQRYLLTIITQKTPWFAIRSLIKDYAAYFEEDIWCEQIQSENPSLLFICWEKKSINYLKKTIQNTLDESVNLNLHWYFSTRESFLANGLKKSAWQEVRLPDR